MTNSPTCYLTKNQRTWLIDKYCSKISQIDDSLTDECFVELTHMKNPDLYNECKEFMFGCMHQMKVENVW